MPAAPSRPPAGCVRRCRGWVPPRRDARSTPVPPVTDFDDDLEDLEVESPRDHRLTRARAHDWFRGASRGAAAPASVAARTGADLYGALGHVVDSALAIDGRRPRLSQ